MQSAIGCGDAKMNNHCKSAELFTVGFDVMIIFPGYKLVR